MKKYLRVLPILTFVLLVIGTVPVKSELISDDFYFLEDKIINYGTFIENGVRLEYSTKVSIEDEIVKLKNNFEKQYKVKVNIDSNTISINQDSMEIKAIVWSNKGDTKVQITYINNNSDITTAQLKKELEQIRNFVAKNIKYFDFVKVKIIEEEQQNILDLLRSNIDEKTIEELDILNGKVSKGKLIDGSKINFSFMTYDEGKYLVIGTPVIFITY